MTTTNALTPDLGGRWLVTTQGSTHVWDLDAMTYERRPGPESPAGAMAYDGIPHRITRVERWPEVDRPAHGPGTRTSRGRSHGKSTATYRAAITDER